MPQVYRDSGRTAPPPAGAEPDAAGTSRDRTTKHIAGTWAIAGLTDYAGAALFGIGVPTAIVYVGDQIWSLAGRTSQPLQTLAGFGSTAGVLALGLLVTYLRQAILNVAARKRFGVLWDVLTFWPRAVHPFAPTCYAERAVPEVVTRARRIVGGAVIDPNGDPAVALQQAELRVGDDAPVEEHSQLLIVGYSQGTPIAAAVVAQLPPEVRARVGLLTLAAPLRRLYGRTFPAYFGADQLELMRRALTGAGELADRTPPDPADVRWRNLVRRSDYIGGAAFQESEVSSAVVDHEIFDPPVLTLDSDPAPPPIHLHSDWFADPQNRPYATTLRQQLAVLPSARPVGSKAGRGT